MIKLRALINLISWPVRYMLDKVNKWLYDWFLRNDDLKDLDAFIVAEGALSVDCVVVDGEKIPLSDYKFERGKIYLTGANECGKRVHASTPIILEHGMAAKCKALADSMMTAKEFDKKIREAALIGVRIPADEDWKQPKVKMLRSSIKGKKGERDDT